MYKLQKDAVRKQNRMTSLAFQNCIQFSTPLSVLEKIFFYLKKGFLAICVQNNLGVAVFEKRFKEKVEANALSHVNINHQ
jgi:hypothetical protein